MLEVSYLQIIFPNLLHYGNRLPQFAISKSNPLTHKKPGLFQVNYISVLLQALVLPPVSAGAPVLRLWSVPRIFFPNNLRDIFCTRNYHESKACQRRRCSLHTNAPRIPEVGREENSLEANESAAGSKSSLLQTSEGPSARLPGDLPPTRLLVLPSSKKQMLCGFLCSQRCLMSEVQVPAPPSRKYYAGKDPARSQGGKKPSKGKHNLFSLIPLKK